jgi:hypothetical protein
MTKLSIDGAIKGLPKKAEQEAAPIEPEEKTTIRQVIYMPRRVHDQVRELAFTKRCSQQELFRRAMDKLFAEEGLASWDELK